MMLHQWRQWGWGLLVVGTILAGAGIALTIIRWCYLVRAMGIPLRMRDAMRIGCLGYLFNLAPDGHRRRRPA